MTFMQLMVKYLGSKGRRQKMNHIMFLLKQSQLKVYYITFSLLAFPCSKSLILNDRQVNNLVPFSKRKDTVIVNTQRLLMGLNNHFPVRNHAQIKSLFQNGGLPESRRRFQTVLQ